MALRFVVWFALLSASFEIAFVAVLEQSAIFHGYLEWTAAASAAMLNSLGFRASRQESTIILDSEWMEVLRGCDGLEVSGFFLIAVLLFPSTGRQKLVGALIGSMLLLILNLARVVSITLAWVYRRDFFETLHAAVWPVIFISAALIIWTAWAMRVAPEGRTA